MKLFIPSCGTSITLIKKWEFDLFEEYRNYTLYKIITGKELDRYSSWSRQNCFVKASLSAGTVLTIDRLYIKRSNNDYNSVSFIVKKTSLPKKGRLRFWAKLHDVNNIEFEVYDEQNR
jgi:hypothetical protein